MTSKVSVNRASALAREGDIDGAQQLLLWARRTQDLDAAHEACDALVKAGEWREALSWYEERLDALRCPLCRDTGFVSRDCAIESVEEDGVITLREPLIGNASIGGLLAAAALEGDSHVTLTPASYHLRPGMTIGIDVGCSHVPQATHTLCNAIARVAQLAGRLKLHATKRLRYVDPVGPLDKYEYTWEPHPDNPATGAVLKLWVRAVRLWWPVRWFEYLFGRHPEGIAKPRGWYTQSHANGRRWATYAIWDCAGDPLRIYVNGDVAVAGVKGLPPLPHISECLCVAAHVRRYMCPADCHQGFIISSQAIVDDRLGPPSESYGVETAYRTCFTCGGDGKCPRCKGGA